jgi:hypothetical protein
MKNPKAKKLLCAYCREEIHPPHHRVTLYSPNFKRELKRQYYHADCYTEKILKESKVD